MGGGIRIVSLTNIWLVWILFTFRIYYQHDPERLSVCTLTIHAILHIADSIKAMGPVWCYWAFPMERYCGTLKRAIQSCRFPLASLDRFVAENAFLTQIGCTYDITDHLTLRPPLSRCGDFSHPQCMLYVSSCIFTSNVEQTPHACFYFRGCERHLPRVS